VRASKGHLLPEVDRGSDQEGWKPIETSPHDRRHPSVHLFMDKQSFAAVETGLSQAGAILEEPVVERQASSHGIHFGMASSRILVVDDDPNFLHFVTELLIGAAYDAVGCSNPDRARTMAQSFKPDLVILDLSMPGKDGFEVAKELRDDPKTSSARILFLTAYRASTHVKKAKASGGAAYLEKPVPSATLLWMVKALIANPPRRRVKAR
jgi:CheY-like chemotaxis protein